MFVVASDADWNGGLGEGDAYVMLWWVEKHEDSHEYKLRRGGVNTLSVNALNKTVILCAKQKSIIQSILPGASRDRLCYLWISNKL